MKIYGKISHFDGFRKWEKSIWDFFMGNCSILVIELFHLKMGKISKVRKAATFDPPKSGGGGCPPCPPASDMPERDAIFALQQQF